MVSAKSLALAQQKMIFTSAKEVMFLPLHVCLLAGQLKTMCTNFYENFWTGETRV